MDPEEDRMLSGENKMLSAQLYELRSSIDHFATNLDAGLRKLSNDINYLSTIVRGEEKDGIEGVIPKQNSH